MDPILFFSAVLSFLVVPGLRGGWRSSLFHGGDSEQYDWDARRRVFLPSFMGPSNRALAQRKLFYHCHGGQRCSVPGRHGTWMSHPFWWFPWPQVQNTDEARMFKLQHECDRRYLPSQMSAVDEEDWSWRAARSNGWWRPNALGGGGNVWCCKTFLEARKRDGDRQKLVESSHPWCF